MTAASLAPFTSDGATVPATGCGAWHEPGNVSDRDDACLLAFHALPVIECLGFRRQQACGDDHGHQPAAA